MDFPSKAMLTAEYEHAEIFMNIKNANYIVTSKFSIRHGSIFIEIPHFQKLRHFQGSGQELKYTSIVMYQIL